MPSGSPAQHKPTRRSSAGPLTKRQTLGLECSRLTCFRHGSRCVEVRVSSCRCHHCEPAARRGCIVCTVGSASSADKHEITGGEEFQHKVSGSSRYLHIKLVVWGRPVPISEPGDGAGSKATPYAGDGLAVQIQPSVSDFLKLLYFRASRPIVIGQNACKS